MNEMRLITICISLKTTIDICKLYNVSHSSNLGKNLGEVHEDVELAVEEGGFIQAVVARAGLHVRVDLVSLAQASGKGHAVVGPTGGVGIGD